MAQDNLQRPAGVALHYKWPIFLAFLIVGTFVVLGAAWQLSTKDRDPVAEWPRYFSLLKEGKALEVRGRYFEAITLYRSAIGRVGEIDPTLKTEAVIAASNRIAACYVSLGHSKEAKAAFKASVRLGDFKHAPKWLRKLEKARPSRAPRRE